MFDRTATRRTGMTMTEMAVVLAIVGILGSVVVAGATSVRRNQLEVAAPVALAAVHTETVQMASSAEYAYRLPPSEELASLLRFGDGTVFASTGPDVVSVATVPDGVVFAVRGAQTCTVVYERFSARTVWAVDIDTGPGRCAATFARDALDPVLPTFDSGALTEVGRSASEPWDGLELD